MKKSIVIVLIIISNVVNAQKVVGYLASWAEGFNEVSFKYLTHVNYSFVTPYSNGSLRLENFDSNKLQETQKKAKEAKVKLFIAVGGWDLGDGGGNDEAFEALASNDKSIQNFVKNITQFVKEYNLDGVDIDWEYPNGIESAKKFTLLMKTLSSELNAQGKLLTFAAVGDGINMDGLEMEVFEYVDWVNIMCYDHEPAPHSDIKYGEQCIKEWQAKGLSKEKLVLGVPFYGKHPEKAYKDIIADNIKYAQLDSQGEIYYNGIPTIVAKTKLAKLHGSGIMIWEISQDTQDDTSLIKAIFEEMF